MRLASKARYQITGVYKEDNGETIGYELVDNNGKRQRYTNSQVYFLAGARQLINADGQLSKDKVILTGIGCNLEDLPTRI